MLTSAAGGPLAWVHPEIEVALDEVERALEHADWGDAASRIMVLAHLHQVSGALHMVELAGPQRLAEELEQLLDSLPGAPDPLSIDACRAAIATLRADLAARLAGDGARDLDLLPALQGLGEARGKAYRATELFHPDLSGFPPGTPDDGAMATHARRLRAEFQRALLAALRTPDVGGHTQAFAATLRSVAGQAPGYFGPQRWELLSRVMAAVPADEADAVTAVDLRQLCTWTDRQLRRNCSPEDQPNDLLVCEALYLAGTFPAPDAELEGLLCAARVPELLAPRASAASAHAAAASNPLHAELASLLARAEERLEAWFRAQSGTPLPDALDQDLVQAACHLDALGEDAALLLLEEARQALGEFPSAAQLSEARLEPVAERLTGLHLFADGLNAGDGQARLRLDALRQRLREVPGSDAALPARAPDSAPDLVAHDIDETLFGVFLEEADTLLRSLHAAAAQLAQPNPAGAIVGQARVCLQTLRGSGLVAGLLPLAQLCGELDHTLAAWTPRGELPWDAPAGLLDDSARELARWLARLASDRTLPLPAVALIDRARSLRAQPALALAPLISLQDIFLEEAGDRLDDLRVALGQDPARVERTGEALRAVHTLAGIARTAGHPGMAELARAMETVLEVMRGSAPPAASCLPVMERLHGAVGVLADMRACLVAGRPLQAADELARVLRRDADLLHEQALQPVPAAHRPATIILPALDAEAIDHPDEELLPVFLEECAELLPQLDAALRAWSEGAGTEQGARALKRGLHTLKGSARMSGLLRQGALAHRLEDLVQRWSETGQEPDAQGFDEIQAGLDHLALGIEQLAHPEHLAPLPAEQAEASLPVLPLSSPVTHVPPASAEHAGAEACAEHPAPPAPIEPASLHLMDQSAGERATFATPPGSEAPGLTGPVDAEIADAATADATSAHSGTAAADAVTADATSFDAATTDVATTDATTADARTADVPTAEADTVTAGTVTADSATFDAVTVDAATFDAATFDAATFDAATADTATADTATASPATANAPTAEAATAEAAPAEAGTANAVTADAPTADGESSSAQVHPRRRAGDLPAGHSEEWAPLERDAEAGPTHGLNDTVSPLLRIRVESLDRMSNAAGEAGIGRARLETEAAVLKRGLGDLAENIQRLKSQLREIEIHAERALPAALPELGGRHGFDPLEMDRYSRLQELARSLAEGIDDVQTVHQGLRRGVDEVELALRQQGRVIRDLQQDLLRARMVPFASLAERLQRTTRQAGRECGRELAFQLEGGQNEVDRSILERLAAPLEHLLRNAAVHGIETPEVRQDLGKPSQGQLTIQLTPGEHEVSLRISDDGRGVDLARVRTQAEASGLLAPGQHCPDEELLQLIFRPGFSTARSVTSLAGRGVGLDVVRSEVIGLGGRIHLDTRPGAGTDFTLVSPVTLATVQAVVVRAGDAWFAIPAPLVEQVRPVPREALVDLYRERVAVWQGLRYPFTSLTRVLGLDTGEPEPQGAQQLVFLRSADRRCALRVDELAGAQEIVVKSVSPHLARIPGVSGASVLGNGRIVLILNPVPLAVGADGMIPDALLPPEPRPVAPTIMVVDDSITVRRVTTRLLERAGYQVRLAKDGQDALEQLAGDLPDVVLLDVEMPRMDGFELITRLRGEDRTRELPVVVITSRTADRHRSHADALGVQGYLGKPYREEDLIGLLSTLLQASCPLPAGSGHPPPAPVPLTLVR